MPALNFKYVVKRYSKRLILPKNSYSGNFSRANQGYIYRYSFKRPMSLQQLYRCSCETAL